MLEPIVIHHDQGSGDAVALSGAIRDLHVAHPCRFATWFAGPAREIFQHHPNVQAGDIPSGTRAVNVEVRSNRWGDSVRWFPLWHQELGERLDVEIPVTEYKPDIHLSVIERTAPLIHEKYWLLFSGGQTNATVKIGDPADYQRMADHFSGRFRFVQVGTAGQWNFPLCETINLIGRTSRRDLMRLAYHAAGVVCSVSFGMHLAAAFDRPCVVLGGGFEHPSFYAYPGQKILHTLGQMDCCQRGACWKRMVEKDCLRPVEVGIPSGPVAECMKRAAMGLIEAIEDFEAR